MGQAGQVDCLARSIVVGVQVDHDACVGFSELAIDADAALRRYCCPRGPGRDVRKD